MMAFKTYARQLRLFVMLPGFFLALGACTQTYSVDVKTSQKISATQGNLNSTLNTGDQFGAALANLGDLNGDGVPELAVGSPYDDESGTDSGAVRILFLDSATGQVQNTIKLTSGLNGFTGPLLANDHFGSALAGIGDLDGDGIPDMAVGAPGDDDNGTARGAVWILFLNADGSVHNQQKISDLSGIGLNLSDNDQFGGAVANVGDINGDGIPDLAVGAVGCDDGGSNRGAVYILFMNRDGTVQSVQKISSTSGNFVGPLHDEDHFGSAVAGVGDLDGDGIPDIAVGASGDDSGGTDRGAVWILFMNRDGTVKAQQKISQVDGKFDELLSDGESFGSSLANIGDLNGDGRDELAVGANQNGDGGPARGAVYVLFLQATGEVISSSRISQTVGNFTDTLTDGEQFGDAITGLGDLDGDGNKDIAVGANLDNDGASGAGAAWVLFLNPVKIGVRANPNVNMDTYFSGKG